jgi:hypothetical protein
MHHAPVNLNAISTAAACNLFQAFVIEHRDLASAILDETRFLQSTGCNRDADPVHTQHEA